MRINVHAGHNPDGKKACGVVGFLRESTEARLVKDAVISQLRQLGHTVYDCTCEDGKSQSDILAKIVGMCNSHEVDLDVSIHFNSAANDPVGNGRTTGVETWVYSKASGAKQYAERVCQAISGLGFKSRGVKYNADLYVLRKTKAPAMLVECCWTTGMTCSSMTARGWPMQSCTASLASVRRCRKGLPTRRLHRLGQRPRQAAGKSCCACRLGRIP